MLSASIEEYIKTVYALNKDKPATTNDIAAELDVAASSVTKMIKKLDELGFAKYYSHKGVTLTELGTKQSLKILRRHRLLETFLHDILEYSWDEVHEEANVLEHYITEKFEDSIYKLLGNPKYDPHGDPIPNKDGTLQEEYELHCITDIEPNKDYTISRIMPDDSEILKYLAKLKLTPGVKITVIDQHPFGGPIIIKRGEEELSVGIEAAKYIWVR